MTLGSSTRNSQTRIDKRPTQAWQTQAWQSFEAIGEVHYAMSLLGAVMSRVQLYVGVVTATDQPPQHIDDYLLRVEANDPTPTNSRTVDTLTQARHLLEDLTSNTPGGEGGLLRQMGINLSVPGELYLVQSAGSNPSAGGAAVGPADSNGVSAGPGPGPTPGANPAGPPRWIIASTDELVQRPNGGYALRQGRPGNGASATTQPSSNRKLPGDEALPNDAFVARIWRSHPRWSREPDSSLLGVLDSCEQLIILQQTLRSITRSRMGAGAIFIPEGIGTFVDPSGTQPDQVEEALTRAAMTAVEDESDPSTLVPLVLKGPAELGDKIKWISYGRTVDDQLVALIDRTLERILQGLDIPKETVAGLANVRYSNAIVIDDNLYRSHIEPLVLLATGGHNAASTCDRSSSKQTNASPQDLANPDHIINRTVVWADTSAVVTRPDRSQAANEGFDKRVLSADAWRQARGFADSDAPTPEELLQRTVLDKAVLPPDLVQTLLELVAPEFFASLHQQTADQLPSDISSLLLPGTQPAPEPAPPTTRQPGPTPTPEGAPQPDQRNRANPTAAENRPPSGTNGQDRTASPGGSPAPIPQR